MVKLILYMHPLSCPSRAVTYVAKYLDLDIEYKIIDILKRETLSPEYIKINPNHTVPTLVDGDDLIYDSHAICAYLVSKYGKNDKMYPKDLVKRALVDARLYFDSCDLFSRVRSIYGPVLYYGASDLNKEILLALQEVYVVMERYLKEYQYLCGDVLTIADLCCYSTISAVDDFAPIDGKKCPKLTAWLKRILELPCCNDEGAEGLKKLIREKLAENRSAK